MFAKSSLKYLVNYAEKRTKLLQKNSDTHLKNSENICNEISEEKSPNIEFDLN